MFSNYQFSKSAEKKKKTKDDNINIWKKIPGGHCTKE